MKYTVDYTQDEDGRWSARASEETRTTLPDGRVSQVGGAYDTPLRLTIEDCVADVYEAVGEDATLEVGDVREWPGLGL